MHMTPETGEDMDVLCYLVKIGMIDQNADFAIGKMWSANIVLYGAPLPTTVNDGNGSYLIGELLYDIKYDLLDLFGRADSALKSLGLSGDSKDDGEAVANGPQDTPLKIETDETIRYISPCGTHYVKITKAQMRGPNAARNLRIVKEVVSGDTFKAVGEKYGLATSTIDNIVARFFRESLVLGPTLGAKRYWKAYSARRNARQWIDENRGWIELALAMHDTEEKP
jgi:hypothetical protein